MFPSHLQLPGHPQRHPPHTVMPHLVCSIHRLRVGMANVLGGNNIAWMLREKKKIKSSFALRKENTAKAEGLDSRYSLVKMQALNVSS